jgi:hypothetical protein
VLPVESSGKLVIYTLDFIERRNYVERRGSGDLAELGSLDLEDHQP